jgi:hypothetical protein
MPRPIYGWTADGKAYLSPLPSTAGLTKRPANEYPNREAAEAEIARRNERPRADGSPNVELVWEG